MKEIWKLYKEIQKGCGIYRRGDRIYVSNFGRCRINERVFDPYVRPDGYKMFCHKRLNRLVYELFVGKIPEGYVIDHIDTNPSNNRLDNLRAVTPKENQNNPLTRKHNSDAHKGKPSWNKGKKGVQTAWNKGLKGVQIPWNKGLKGVQTAWNKGKKCPHFSGEKNPRSRQVYQIDKNSGEIIKKWPCSMEIEREICIDHRQVWKCCNGKRKQAGGFVWRYVDSYIPPYTQKPLF